MMKQKIFLTISVTVIILTNSCKDNGTGPETLEPGRRDYVWTVDTIIVPFTYFDKMWGDASDNVWAVGPGGSLKTVIWHYDGNNWSTDGIPRTISPLGVFGFSKNDVWISGYEGRIWHYNGVEWKQNIRFTKQNWTIGFSEIWGDSPSNIFATGYADSSTVRKGIIIRWNGYTWTEISIPVFPTYAFVKMRKSRNDNGNFIILGWGEKSNGGDLLALFEFDGTNIKKIYENDFANETWTEVSEIGDKLLYVIGNKICKYNNSNFIPFLEIDASKFKRKIFGRNEKDIFISMSDGISHYNGTDIRYIYKYTGNNQAFDEVVLANQIFILTNNFDNYSNTIIRGKLP